MDIYEVIGMLIIGILMMFLVNFVVIWAVTAKENTFTIILAVVLTALEVIMVWTKEGGTKWK